MTDPVVTAPALETKPAVAAETVEVKVGDKTLKVSKEVAETIKAVQDAAAQSVATIKAEAAAAIKAATPAPKVPAATDAEENYDDLFTKPKEFITKLRNEIKDELRAEYTQTEGQKDFWRAFYKAHPDLEKHDFYVKSVLDRDLKTLTAGGVTVTDAIAKLGTTVKTELLALGGKSAAGDARPRTEGGTEGRKPQSNAGSEDSPAPADAPKDTLTGILKGRAEARRKGGKPAQATA